jgi:hypothetical protein
MKGYHIKIVCGLAMLAAVAGAIMAPQSTAELTAHATLVISGTVEKVKSYAPLDSSKDFYTEASVRVTGTVVGSTSEDVVVVRHLGGEIGEWALVVEDQPSFREGEQVILYLAPSEKGGYVCPDGAQSKLTVVEDTVLGDGRTVNEYLAAVAAAARP